MKDEDALEMIKATLSDDPKAGRGVIVKRTGLPVGTVRRLLPMVGDGPPDGLVASVPPVFKSYTDSAVVLSESATDVQIAEGFHWLERQADGMMWRLGDFLSQVAKLRPTKQAKDASNRFVATAENERVRAFIEASTLARSTCYHAIKVSEAFPVSNRLDTVTWTHYFTSLTETKDVDSASAWIGYVEEKINKGGRVSTRELRDAIRGSLLKSLADEGGDPVVTLPSLVPIYRLSNQVRKVQVDSLDSTSREKLATALKPAHELYIKLGGDLETPGEGISLTS